MTTEHQELATQLAKRLHTEGLTPLADGEFDAARRDLREQRKPGFTLVDELAALVKAHRKRARRAALAAAR